MIFDRLKKYRAYSRTKREIASLDIGTALDLNIYPGDAAKIAQHAVYGN